MAQIGTERWGQYKKYVLEILAESNSSIHANQVFERLDQLLPPNEFEKASYPNTNNQRRPYIVRFATISLVKAGWLKKDHGYWQITDEGRTALAKFKSPLELEKAANALYRDWKRNQDPDEAEEEPEETSLQVAVSFEEAEANAFALIHTYLSSMPPYRFQELIRALVEAMGYKVTWVAPPGKDGGIDLIAFQDYFGTSGPRIKIQVKRTASTMSVDAIRSFLGVLSERDDVGIFVCLAGFTQDAEKEARNHSSKRLTLIDARNLYELWIENYSKITLVDRQLLPIRPVYYLVPEE